MDKSGFAEAQSNRVADRVAVGVDRKTHYSPAEIANLMAAANKVRDTNSRKTPQSL